MRGCNKSLTSSFGKRRINGKLKGSDRRLVVGEFVSQLGEDGPAVRQVAEVALEACEASDHFALHPEGWSPYEMHCSASGMTSRIQLMESR